MLIVNGDSFTDADLCDFSNTIAPRKRSAAFFAPKVDERRPLWPR